jgi:SAM-dependent methyltransferase
MSVDGLARTRERRTLLSRLSRRRALVVYTVLTGVHEALANPFPSNATGFERICFTDDPELSSDDWTVVLLDSPALDAARESRRPKLLAHKYLSDFDWSLYVDGTVRFKVTPVDIQREYGTRQAPFVCFRHPWRDCIFDEGEEVIRFGMDSERRVREQLDYYRSNGFMPHAGLVAGGVLLRRHRDPDVVRLCEEWFDHILRFSKRDQLSFNYVAWRQRFSYSHFKGDLVHNDLIEWPAPQEWRIPHNFSDDTYLWLNPDAAESGVAPRRHYIEFGRARNLPYTTHLWELDRLANKYRSDKGSLYYNAHGYAAVYEHHLREDRLADLHILELGLLRHDVQARNPGGPYDDVPSLKMWREYCPNARIVGFDIADFSTAPPLAGVRIVRGDMGRPEDLRSLVEQSDGEFDVIIDDGSHASHHQQIALAELFPHLKPGGHYFVEDLLYQPPHWEPANAVKTRDILISVSKGESTSSPYVREDHWRYFTEHVECVHFYDSHDRQFGHVAPDALAVIRKKADV